MSSEIRVAGKTFNKGEVVYYDVGEGKREQIIVDKSQDTPPGLILENTHNKRRFAITAATVATKITKKTTTQTTQNHEPDAQSDGVSEQQNNTSPNNQTQNYDYSNNQQNYKKPRIKDTSKKNKTVSELLMFFAFLVLCIDIFVLNASIDPGAVTIRIIIYAILVFVTALTLNLNMGSIRGFLEDAKILIILASIPAIIIPGIAYIAQQIGATENTISLIAGLIIMLPLYQTYLFFNERLTYTLAGDTRGQKAILFLIQPSSWLRIYFAWLIGSLIVFLISMIPRAATMASEGSELMGISDSGFEPREILGGAGKIITAPINSITNAIRTTQTRLNKTYHDLYNDTLGEYYTGQVEQNRELTGVFIRDINTMGTYYEGQPVELFANIQMRSFVDEINMTTSCYAQNPRNRTDRTYGTTDPEQLINVYKQDYRGVKCTFNETQLKPGRQTIVFELDFNFETWAYITLTIMDRDFLSSLQQGNVDVHRRYDINRRVRTIYTNGPVMLGMNDGMDLPLPISTDQTSSNMIPLGITIDDRRQTGGATGEIRRVNSFELRTPPEFQINKTRCMIPGSGTITSTPDGEIGYTVHSFDVSKTPGKYLSVSCNAEITREGAISLLNDPTGKTDITIAGSATYDYYLRRQTDIRITETN